VASAAHLFVFGGRKMKQTLSDLWRGELRPVDEKTDKEEELKELYVTLEVYYTKLWNKLDSEGKDLLDELRDCHTDIMCLENEGTFIQGFSLATKMINEALSD
jgi:hypothetical protein